MSLPTWDEHVPRMADDLQLDGRVWGAHDHQRAIYAGMFPETFYGSRLGAESRCYVCGGAVYGSLAPQRVGSRDDIDTIIARLLEGYRILDELFNPRRNRTPSTRTGENRQPETRSMANEQTE